MFKSLLVVSAVLISAGSGLVSCSPDNGKTKVVDNFRANPPKILRGEKGDLQISKETLSDLTTIDLQDQIDFSNSKGTFVALRTVCKARGRNVTHETGDLKSSDPLLVSQLLASELLIYDVNTEQVSCAFTAKVFNAAGSYHVMDLPLLQLTDSRAPAVLVGRDGLGLQPLNAAELAGVYVRADSREPSTATLTCEDVDFPPVPFKGNMPLTTLDVANPQPRDLLNPGVWLNRPNQTCRIVIVSGKTQWLSSSLKIQFPLPPLTAEVVPTTKPPNVGTPGGQSFVMSIIRVNNPVPAIRSVVVTNKHFNVNSIALAHVGIPKGSGKIQWLHYQQVAGVAPQYGHIGPFEWREELGKTFEYQVPPNGYVDIPLKFSYNNFYKCPIGQVEAHSLQFGEPVTLGTKDPQGAETAPLIVDQFPFVWGHLPAGVDPNAFKGTYGGGSCGWF